MRLTLQFLLDCRHHVCLCGIHVGRQHVHLEAYPIIIDTHREHGKFPIVFQLGKRIACKLENKRGRGVKNLHSIAVVKVNVLGKEARVSGKPFEHAVGYSSTPGELE